MRAALLGALLLLAGCSSEPKESVAVADQESGVKAPKPDLDSLAAMRASSEGGALTDELQAARSLNAQKAYASGEDEPSKAELDAAGVAPAPGETSFDPVASANAGTKAPSDLDTLDDAPTKPWINMQLVEDQIRSRDRSMKSCWDSHGPGGPGRVEMSMTIGAGGRASGVRIAPGSPNTGSALGDCLARVLRNVKYPEPRNGSVTFIYPVKF